MSSVLRSGSQKQVPRRLVLCGIRQGAHGATTMANNFEIVCHGRYVAGLSTESGADYVSTPAENDLLPLSPKCASPGKFNLKICGIRYC